MAGFAIGYPQYGGYGGNLAQDNLYAKCLTSCAKCSFPILSESYSCTNPEGFCRKYCGVGEGGGGGGGGGWTPAPPPPSCPPNFIYNPQMNACVPATGGVQPIPGAEIPTWVIYAGLGLAATVILLLAIRK